SGYTTDGMDYPLTRSTTLSDAKLYNSYRDILNRSMKEAYSAGYETVIKIAPHADTEEVRADGKFKGLASKLGMNIYIPDERATLEEVQFVVTLTEGGSPSRSAFVKDGFPTSKVDIKHLITGQIDLNVSETLTIIPKIPGISAGEKVAKVIKFDPIKFKLALKREISILFGGPLDEKALWFFKGSLESLGVALTINAPEGLRLDAQIEARWKYVHKHWPIESIRMGAEAKTVPIYP
ncbi:MAG: hypothetical protein QUS08_00120, partial [Methanothrix sp.]|nr:hypothetical protein [Methanothrix sp.]